MATSLSDLVCLSWMAVRISACALALRNWKFSASAGGRAGLGVVVVPREEGIEGRASVGCPPSRSFM